MKAPPVACIFFYFTPRQQLIHSLNPLHTLIMLDLNDFISDRGGDPKKIKESQRRRFASEEAVDQVIALYEEARRGTSIYSAMTESYL